VAHLQHDYAGARERYEESLALTRGIGDQRGMAIVLNNLGFTHYALGDDGAAKRCFDEALQVALSIKMMPIVLEVLVGVARLQARAGHPVEAVELLGLAVSHPGTNTDVQTQADLFLTELGAELTGEQVAAALERGKGRDLVATIAALGQATL
jgi:tetratricopeptide (TPR) repeat protein